MTSLRLFYSSVSFGRQFQDSEQPAVKSLFAGPGGSAPAQHTNLKSRMVSIVSLLLRAGFLLSAQLAVTAYVISPAVCFGSRKALTLRPTRVVSSTISLRMNLGERFVRLFKANVNELLNKNEDPEKLLNQSEISCKRIRIGAVFRS